MFCNFDITGLPFCCYRSKLPKKCSCYSVFTTFFAGVVLDLKQGRDGCKNATYVVQYDDDDILWDVPGLVNDLDDGILKVIDD